MISFALFLPFIISAACAAGCRDKVFKTADNAIAILSHDFGWYWVPLAASYNLPENTAYEMKSGGSSSLSFMQYTFQVGNEVGTKFEFNVLCDSASGSIILPDMTEIAVEDGADTVSRENMRFIKEDFGEPLRFIGYTASNPNVLFALGPGYDFRKFDFSNGQELPELTVLNSDNKYFSRSGPNYVTFTNSNDHFRMPGNFDRQGYMLNSQTLISLPQDNAKYIKALQVLGIDPNYEHPAPFHTTVEELPQSVPIQESQPVFDDSYLTASQ